MNNPDCLIVIGLAVIIYSVISFIFNYLEKKQERAFRKVFNKLEEDDKYNATNIDC